MEAPSLEIPGHVAFAEGNGGLPKVLVTTPWSEAEIYLHGAHVTDFRKSGEAPLLFMSAASDFHPEKPIRGGVPLIFPWFGPREGLPSHGYARTTLWSLEETNVFAGGEVMLRFRMPTQEDLTVEYIVRVGAKLSLELAVTYTGQESISFETCFHTYFLIGDIHTATVTGLKGCHYLDKLQGALAIDDPADAIAFQGETERVYTACPETTHLIDPTLGRSIRIAKSGSRSTVIWNPWIEKSRRMPDIGDEEYLRMLCIESGNVAPDSHHLFPSSRATLRVEISSSPLPHQTQP